MGPLAIEDISRLGQPLHLSDLQDLLLFGAAVYEVKFPGVRCSSSSCPAGAYYFVARDFRPVPETIAARVIDLRRRDQHNIPIADFETLFGRRRPTRDDPSGFRFQPGADAGEVRLYLPRDRPADIIWPKWRVGVFISQTVVDLFNSNDVHGLRYHPVAEARVVGEELFRRLVNRWEWDYTRFVRAVAGGDWEQASVTYYEIEAVGPPADCGLRERLECPHCGCIEDDTTNVRTEGAIDDYNGNDFFLVKTMESAFCTPRVIDLLERHEIRLFEVRSLPEVIAGLIELAKE